MFGILKKMFPKKGENYDEMDEMYSEEGYDEEEDVPKLENNYPPQEQEMKFTGFIPELLAKFKRKKKDDEYSPEDVEEFPTQDMPGIDSGFIASEEEEANEAALMAANGNSPGLLSKINNLEGPPKFAFLGIVTALLVFMIFTGIKMFRGGSKPANKLPDLPPPVETPATTSSTPPDNPTQVASAVPMAGAPGTTGGIMDNPFTEQGLNDLSNPENPNPTIVNNPPIQSRTLPTIPAMSRSNIPAGGVPMPSSAPDVSQPDKSRVVSGVITGSNASDNIAIMGDGTIVKVGETYNDGRIAFIGGDGITFEDGTQIKMQP